MPSSISNSDANSDVHLHIPERPVPPGRWALPWIVSLSLAATGIVTLELFVRARGFQPSVTDDRFLWAWERASVSNGSPHTLALVGASRIHVGWSAAVGHELLPHWTTAQLAVSGSAPIGTLQDLAADVDFRGVAIVDMSEGHFVKKAWRRQRAQVSTYGQRWLTPGAMAERWLATQLQSRLALLNAGGRRTLDAMLTWRQLPGPPEVTTNADRTRWVDRSAASLRKVRAKRLRNMNDLYKPGSPERWLAAARKVEPLINAIQARGGKVVYLRMPTCDERWAVDEARAPKADYWDRLAAETHADASVHFRDHPALAGFECPDTSHIASEDSAAFTRALLTLLIDRKVIVP